MTYEPEIWVDETGTGDGTVVTAARMNHIENGVAAGATPEDVAAAVDAASTEDRDRANHTGAQVAATISDFVNEVRANRLNQMTAPDGAVAFHGGTLALPGIAFVGDPNTGIASTAADQLSFIAGGASRLGIAAATATFTVPLSMNSKKITALAAGTANTDGVTKGQMDAADTAAKDRANHTGTQAAATISDLAAVVKGYRLDEFASPNTDLVIAANRITEVADPVDPQDAATKAWVETQVAAAGPGDPGDAPMIANLTGATSYTFTGLDGNVDRLYELLIEGVMGASAGGYVLVRPNNDSAANYANLWLYGYNASAFGNSVGPTNGLAIMVGQNISDQQVMARAVVRAKSGARRGILSDAMADDNQTPFVRSMLAGRWTNTASNIVSLTVSFPASFTGTVTLRKVLAPTTVVGGGAGGGMLDRFSRFGSGSGYVSFANLDPVYADAAKTQRLQWFHTPTQDCVLKAKVLVGLIQWAGGVDVTDYGYLNLSCAPQGTGQQARRRSIFSYGGMPYRGVEVSGSFELVAGTAYNIQAYWEISFGTWQFHQDPTLVSFEAETWAL